MRFQVTCLICKTKVTRFHKSKFTVNIVPLHSNSKNKTCRGSGLICLEELETELTLEEKECLQTISLKGY